jgi:hypothetical protein
VVHEGSVEKRKTRQHRWLVVWHQHRWLVFFRVVESGALDHVMEWSVGCQQESLTHNFFIREEGERKTFFRGVVMF